MTDNRLKLEIRWAVLDMIKNGAYHWVNDDGLAVCAYCGQPAFYGDGEVKHADNCIYDRLIKELLDGEYDLKQ